MRFPTRAAVLAVLIPGMAVCGTCFAKSDAARLAALQARVKATATETAYVEAITRVQRLGRAFGYYVDKGYFGEAADLFTDDGSFQWGVDGVYRGKARIRELLTRHGGGSMNDGPGLPFGRLNLRMQLQPVVTVAADGRSAHARWREWGLLGVYKRSATWSDAIIEDDYVLQDGVWKIAARRYYLNFEAPYQGGWAALKPVSGSWQSQVALEFPPDAPSPIQYQPFPAVFVPPYDYADNPRAIRSRPPVNQPARPDDALGRLETLADATELQLGRVESERAIENLQAMYGYYIDKGRWRQAAALFSRDGSYEFGQSGVYIGNGHIEKALSLMGPPGLAPGQLNNYVMEQQVIHVSADNRTARARWRSDVLLSRDGKGRWGGGVYENEYVNDRGTWKFSKLHYYVTFWGDYDQGWAAKPIPMDPPSTVIPPDRPPTVVYRSFPKLNYVPFDYPHPVTGKPIVQDHEGTQVSQTAQAAPAALAAQAAPAAPVTQAARTTAAAQAPAAQVEPTTDLQAVEDQLNAVGTRLTRLQDLTDIEILQHTYGYFVDKAQWHPLSDLFAADATLEIGGKGVFLGHDRVYEYMRTGLGPIGPRDGLLIDHQQFQCLPSVDADGVTGHVRCIAFVMSSGGWGHNYYEDVFTKQDGIWKFKRLHGPFNMYAGYKIGWLDNTVLNTYPEKFPPPPDLPPSVVYLTYPNYYVEPFDYPNPVTGRPMPPPSPRAGGEAFGRLPLAKP